MTSAGNVCLRSASFLRSALFLGAAMLSLAAPPTQAAFEWEHPTPASLVCGDSPLRWPTAGEGAGIRADAFGARPWGWPGVGAAALRIGGAGSKWTMGIALSQLRAAGYRESRLAAGLEQAVSGQRLSFVASSIAADVGGESPFARSRSGTEIDLGWALDGAPLDLAVRAYGAWSTPGARALASPRRFRFRLGVARSFLRSELMFEEGTSGRRMTLGLRTRPFDAVDLGAAWSSTDPTIRLFVAVWRGRLALSAGRAWHSILPATHLVGLSHGNHLAPPDAESGP